MFLFSHRDQYCEFDWALFYNEMKNLIYRATRSFRYKNISQASMFGFELNLTWSVHKFLSGECGYSYIDFDQSTTELNDYVPQHKVHLILTSRTGFGTVINYEAAYVDERVFMYGSNSVSSLPDYLIQNINFSQALSKYLTVRLEVSNVTDEYYEEEFGFPQPGRQIMGGVKLSF